MPCSPEGVREKQRKIETKRERNRQMRRRRESEIDKQYEKRERTSTIIKCPLKQPLESAFLPALHAPTTPDATRRYPSLPYAMPACSRDVVRVGERELCSALLPDINQLSIESIENKKN